MAKKTNRSTGSNNALLVNIIQQILAMLPAKVRPIVALLIVIAAALFGWLQPTEEVPSTGDETVQTTGEPAGGNKKIESFNTAKHLLEDQVYNDHRTTFYCNASFDANKNIKLPKGFRTPEHEERAKRVEWEHVVPAEHFGRSFTEWREGAEVCRESDGTSYKGRKCAEKASKEYRLMQADLYNLYPAIGAVNAMRLNYYYDELPNAKVTFGTCPMKIEGEKAEPPEYTRGAIARTTLYMAQQYPRYRLSDQQRKLMEAWNKMYA
ncbi:endonuclease, partial [Sutterella sp.]|uniref:endonuclease n=1 Tax=Sutterella sp. TaxID=1981025 RepID=UPI0026DF8E50